VEWPNGFAALLKKYRPQDTITRVELRQVLNTIKRRAWILRHCSSIENNKYNTATKKIDQDYLIAVVLDAAPPSSYQSLLTSEQRRGQGSKMTIADLEAIMNLYWRQTHDDDDDDDDNDEADNEDDNGNGGDEEL
jgi:hypothetical protein